MGPSFPRDPEAPTGVRFKCAACGIAFCRRVLVRRENGQNYETEFVSCEGCLVLYHWPGEVPRPDIIDPRAVPGGYPEHQRAADTWTTGSGQAVPLGMTEEELVRIKEAAAGANKSKGKRYRR